MAKQFLKPVYKQIYGDDFTATSFDKRMEMQKGIYLLQESGITVGDYDFLWYKHGPYSQRLQDDMLELNAVPNISICYTEEALKTMKKMNDVLNRQVSYKRSEWAECLASLQYLKANVLSFNAKEDEIVDELINRKPHLSDRELDKTALTCLAEILS